MRLIDFPGLKMKHLKTSPFVYDMLSVTGTPHALALEHLACLFVIYPKTLTQPSLLVLTP